MAEIIPMPSNHESYLKLGDNALAKQDFLRAIHYYEQAYRRTPNFSIARRLVNAYLGNRQPKEALPLISSYLDQWLRTEEDSKMIFDALLAIPDLRFAWGIMPHAPRSAWSAMSVKMDAREQELRETRGKEIMETQRRLRHLGGMKPAEQEDVLDQLGILPRDELIDAIIPDLVDADVHPAVRVSLLDILAAINYDEAVPFLTFDSIRHVIPANLPGIWSDETTEVIMKLALSRLGNHDPALVGAATEMLRFEVGYLYPFAAQQIENPTAFVDAYFGNPQHEDRYLETLISWLHEQTEILGNSLQ